MSCSVPSCDRLAKGRGWCSSHYMRWYRYGDPLHAHQPVDLGRPSIPIATRFWSKVDFSNPDGCWLWKGARRHAYGEVFREGIKMYAHRAAYELIYGPLTEGLEICHACDTPLCVRPDHLVAGTHADNLADMAAKSRWRNQHAAGPGVTP